jgi:uncharacterized protein YybS (DUF2232 family)
MSSLVEDLNFMVVLTLGLLFVTGVSMLVYYFLPDDVGFCDPNTALIGVCHFQGLLGVCVVGFGCIFILWRRKNYETEN